MSEQKTTQLTDATISSNKNNRSRWMTDIGASIEQLKIHDLIIAEAHNAGVDQNGDGWPWENQWFACQDDTFDYQLNNGIRALDLRLYTHKSDYIFKHGGVHVSRWLDGCLDRVYKFARDNPGEIVILDFHEVFVDGTQSNVARKIEFKLRDQVIPPEARNLTIGQIRNRYPGRNVVIAWNYSADFCWRKVHQTWTGKDRNSEYAINQHIQTIMQNPPTNQLWSIFAAGYDELGPVRYKPNALFWNSFFSKTGSERYRQPSKGNMINVDFFAGTGVVDRCIAATRDRANKARLSSATQLAISNITGTSVKLRWTRPQDSETINSYTLYANDQHVANVTTTEYVLTGLTDGKTYHLQVIPNFASGVGAAAEITARTIDITKPGKPAGLKFSLSENLAQAVLSWNKSTDNVGVVRYEIFANNVRIANTAPDYPFYVVNRADLLTYKVRALDAAGNFMDSDPLTMQPDTEPPTKPADLKINAMTSTSVTLEWTPSRDNAAVTGYEIHRNNTRIGTVKDTAYTDNGLTEVAYTYKVRALDGSGNYTDSDPLVVRFDGPTKPANLSVYVNETRTLLMWEPSFAGKGVTGYEIYRNGARLDTVAHTSGSKQMFVAIGTVAPWSFKVRALDAAGRHADSDTVTGP